MLLTERKKQRKVYRDKILEDVRNLRQDIIDELARSESRLGRDAKPTLALFSLQCGAKSIENKWRFK